MRTSRRREVPEATRGAEPVAAGLGRRPEMCEDEKEDLSGCGRALPARTSTSAV